MKEILNRIDRRLEALGLNESSAPVKAGLSKDAIRNIRRAVKIGDESKGVSTNTLFALAPILETTVSWLVEGTGPEIVPIRDPDEIRKTIEKIDGLKPGNVTTLLSMIEGFQAANTARSQPTLPGGQSEPASPHRESSPSR